LNTTFPVSWQPCSLEEWPAMLVKQAFEISLGKMLQPNSIGPDDIETPYIKAMNVQWGNIIVDDLPTMWASPNDLRELNLKIGDLLVCEGGEAGRAAILGKELPNDCIYQNALHRVRSENNDTRYLKYCLMQSSSAGWFDVLCNRATIAHFTVEKFREFRIHIPAPNIQRLIADYLDRETERIDALVAEKKCMLALLEEKRTALISHTITRGLNPDASLKPSGLDWLGDIPAHWNIPPIYARFEVQLGKMLDEKKIKGNHLAPYLRNIDVQWGAINVSNLPEMDFDEEDRVRYSLKPGDILICEGGEIGRSAIWNGELDECYYQKALHRLRSMNGEDDSSFFIYILRTLVDLRVFSSQALAATIQHLPAEKLRNIRYPSPSLSEQRTIVLFLNKETIRMDRISDEIGKSIQLLKERRSALITAAVTGQISIEAMTV
jgi:type I restriction enzyme, S subunit